MDIFKKCFDFEDARQAKAAGVYPYFYPPLTVTKAPRLSMKVVASSCVAPTTIWDSPLIPPA